MSRYGFSSTRDGLSPFSSQDGQAPRVTDEDFSYITSEDLEHSLQAPGKTYDPKQQPPSSAKLEDDVLLIKNKGITYPAHFPAYSIGDGKLFVRDVRERVGLLLEVPTKNVKRIKMLYKGRQLKDEEVPIRAYNVKNNSEILVVMPDVISDDESDSEEVVVADLQSKSKKKNKRGKKKNSRITRDDLDVPGSGTGKSDNDESRLPSRMPSPPQVPNEPLEKLAAIASHFNTRLLPLCVEFSSNPPKDKKRCEDDHRKLSETIMQQILLKLDEVDADGDPNIRAKRKELVTQVDNVLKGIDEHLPEGSVKPQHY